MRAVMDDRDQRPGAAASRTGHYEELNVFGNPTGKVVHAEEGSTLPAAPRGFSWRAVGCDRVYSRDACAGDSSPRTKKPRR